MIATFLSLLLPCALPQSAPAPASAPAAEAAAPPDIELSITARADEIRWRQVGSISVRVWSEPSGAVIEENLSTGLPRPIPGQRTFRDVEWRLRGAATIASPTPQIEIEAGEAPATETPEGDPE
ncbi:hypothetical protein GGQ87_001424 [Brevundimonas alba]|uniref:Uncharacterized protein n=1 Tax=Brevundimonas alba TaxID=74314 RepID=A0A7X6BP53_9CAUL|nr:hypothetical protein [Brevundimonas alba]NJC41166.1 hypothetical protein [Brevundimonas alba]